jgi:hypothetical protein
MLLVLALACGGVLVAQERATAVRLSEAVRADWAGDEWDDGKAEVAEYEGVRVIDGTPRAHVLYLVTSAEDFNRETNARADWPFGQKPIVAVLQQIQSLSLSDPARPRHLLASSVVERKDPVKVLKLATSSQEWKGITSKEFDFSGRMPRRTWSSYRDAEGSGSEDLRSWPSEAVFDEQLPLLVRLLDLREGLETGMALVESQTTNGAGKPEIVAARVRVESAKGAVKVPAGTWAAEDVWRVVLEGADGRGMEYFVEKAAPQTLLAWNGNDGQTYGLRSVKREAVWQLRE